MLPGRLLGFQEELEHQRYFTNIGNETIQSLLANNARIEVSKATSVP